MALDPHAPDVTYGPEPEVPCAVPHCSNDVHPLEDPICDACKDDQWALCDHCDEWAQTCEDFYGPDESWCLPCRKQHCDDVANREH